jgi:hypothetical protein
MKTKQFFSFLLIGTSLIFSGCNSGGGGGGSSIASSSSTTKPSSSSQPKAPTTRSRLSEDPVTEFAEAIARVKCVDQFDADCIAETVAEEVKTLEKIKIELESETRPEIVAIFDGKKLIMRESDSLENSYFEIKHFHAFSENTKRMIKPSEDDLAEVESLSKLGYHTIIPKKGFEQLAEILPPYVIFHSKIDVNALKEKSYQGIWVDVNNKNCDPTQLNWNEKVSNAIVLEKAKSLLGIIKNPETPSCSISGAIKSVCPYGNRFALNDPTALKKVIIQIKEGTYEEPGDIYLCSGVVLKNYNNENVTITNYTDIKKTTNSSWIQIDSELNIWAIDWTKSPISEVRFIDLDDSPLPVAHHYDRTTMAPDRIDYNLKLNNIPMQEAQGFASRWVDISLMAGKEEEIRIASSLYESAAQVPDSGEFCTLSPELPPRPLWNKFDVVGLRPSQTEFHCLNSKVCQYKSADPEIIKNQTDLRECCPWYDPYNLDGKCESNYRHITNYHMSKTQYHPKFCAKLEGSPEKCLVLKLPKGQDPNNLELKVGMSPSHLFRAHFNESKKIFMKEITLAGVSLKVDTAIYSMILNGNPNWAGDFEYQYRIDGIEQVGPGSLLLQNGHQSEIKNSYFHDTSYALHLMLAKPLQQITNNYFLRTGARSIHITGEASPTVIDFEKDKEYSSRERSRFAWNKIESGGGIEGNLISHLEIDHNHWLKSGGQELTELNGSTEDIIIRDNLYEDNTQIVLLVTGIGLGFHSKYLQFVRNQVINSPTLASKINSSLLFYENPGHSNIGSACRNLLIEENLFLNQHPNLTSLTLPTYCQNSSVMKNLISHSSKATRSSVVLGAYTNGLKNFMFSQNIVFGEVQIGLNPFDTNKKGNFGPGESLEKCVFHTTSFKNYCLTIAASKFPFFGTPEDCQKTGDSRSTSFCRENLLDTTRSTFQNPISENFIFSDNSIAKVHLKDISNEFFKRTALPQGTYGPDISLLEFRASPLSDGIFNYDSDYGLPDYWNNE